MEQQSNEQCFICCDADLAKAVKPVKSSKSGCKMGRPKKHWTKQVARQRTPDPKKLRRCEVDNLRDAEKFAARTGRGFTILISLRWFFTALGEADIRQRWQAVLNHLHTLAKRRGFELAACWAHENPPRSEPAFHTHVAAHIPPRHHQEVLALIAKKLGGSDAAVHGRPYVATDVRYFSKGTDLITAKTRGTIGGNGWQHDQGKIPFKTFGKRAGCTQNIGREARKRFGAEKYSIRPPQKTRCDAGVSQPQKGGFPNSITRVREAEIITC